MAEKPKADLFDLNALSDNEFAEMPDPFFGDSPENEAEGAKYVVFQIGENYYALPAEKVSEVVRMLPVTKFPRLPEWFLGIANLRGEILSVVELPLLWDDDFAGQGEKSKLIVLKDPHSESNLALRVDRLREILVIDDDSLVAASGRNSSHLIGVAQLKSGDVNILNVDSIVSSLALA